MNEDSKTAKTERRNLRRKTHPIGAHAPGLVFTAVALFVAGGAIATGSVVGFFTLVAVVPLAVGTLNGIVRYARGDVS